MIPYRCIRTSVLALPFALGLTACAPAPLYRAGPQTLSAPPSQVARTPEQFADAQLVWGGRIVRVDNLSDHSEIQVLAYPLDSSQRPLPDKPAAGRFIALMPGYVERYDYPQGRLITVNGRLEGVRSGRVGEAAYVFPLVRSAASHVWTLEELRQGHPDIGIGLGVGIGIH